MHVHIKPLVLPLQAAMPRAPERKAPTARPEELQRIPERLGDGGRRGSGQPGGGQRRRPDDGSAVAPSDPARGPAASLAIALAVLSLDQAAGGDRPSGAGSGEEAGPGVDP